MMKELWNERYSAAEYVYGTNPNMFLAGELDKLKPGNILFPAEGEGRNAVFAALRGWNVSAFDFSEKAKEKALMLAKEKNVIIDYTVASYENMVLERESFDCIALIYAHVMDRKRQLYHKNLLKSLRKGGTLILEGFSKDQIKYKTGGPPKVEFLFSAEELTEDFNSLGKLSISELTETLDEGKFHAGKAAIIRVVGTK